MEYGESIASRRRIAVYLEATGTNDPFTGAVPVDAEMMVCLSGAAWANAAGTWVETGSGAYYYIATLAESKTRSFVMLRVAVAGAKVFVFSVDIGDRVAANEPTAIARRFPVYMVDADGEAVEMLAPAGSENQVSKNGASFVDCSVDVVEVGLGAYYWEADEDELDTRGFALLKIVKDPALPYVYRFNVLEAAALPPPEPIEAPFEPGDDEYVDHVEEALSRLVYQLARVS